MKLSPTVISFLVLFAGCYGQLLQNDKVTADKAVNDEVKEALQIANGADEDHTEDEAAKVQDGDEVEDEEDAEPKDDAKTKKASAEKSAAVDAKNAHKAFVVAKSAAKVAKQVATNSIEMTEHAKSALKNAHDAVNRARVDSKGLSAEQKSSLKAAEKKIERGHQRC